MTRKQLEAKYGVKISKSVTYNQHTGTKVTEYEIVTMDGVHWCDGMETIEDVAQVLQESSTIFLGIKCKLENSTCKWCKYYETCGDPDRTEPCKEKEESF